MGGGIILYGEAGPRRFTLLMGAGLGHFCGSWQGLLFIALAP